MPIEVKCSGCSQRLRVPDRTAGKRVKCPKCSKPIRVPALPDIEEPDRLSALPLPQEKKWYIRTDDQQEYGPLAKDVLDLWATEGRLNVDSQLLQEDAKQWQWATDLYPELDVEGIYVGGAEDDPAEKGPVEQAPLEQKSQATAETLAGEADDLFGSTETSNEGLSAQEDDLFSSDSLPNEGLPSKEDDLFSTESSTDLGDLEDLSGFEDLSDLDEP